MTYESDINQLWPNILAGLPISRINAYFISFLILSHLQLKLKICQQSYESYPACSKGEIVCHLVRQSSVSGLKNAECYLHLCLSPLWQF